MSKKTSIVIDDIARRMAADEELTIVESTRRVKAVFSALRKVILTDVTEDGDRVMIDGFGIFKYKYRPERMVKKCPLTGKPAVIPEKCTLTFTPASSFLTEFNA